MYTKGGVDLSPTNDLERLRRLRRKVAAWLGFNFGSARFQVGRFRCRYFLHSYNQTWSNERCVEIALAKPWMQMYRGRTLEVGNVLSHYGIVNHDIVDKYERPDSRAHIIQEDFLTYSPATPYEILVSISTLEHIGQDEDSGRPELAVEALERVPKLLTSDCAALVTFAAGYNRSLDNRVVEESRLTKSWWNVACLQRIDRYCWREVDPILGLDAQYGYPFPCGNMLYVLQHLR